LALLRLSEFRSSLQFSIGLEINSEAKAITVAPVPKALPTQKWSPPRLTGSIAAMKVAAAVPEKQQIKQCGDPWISRPSRALFSVDRGQPASRLVDAFILLANIIADDSPFPPRLDHVHSLVFLDCPLGSLLRIIALFSA
jgi:hypothetical protein